MIELNRFPFPVTCHCITSVSVRLPAFISDSNEYSNIIPFNPSSTIYFILSTVIRYYSSDSFIPLPRHRLYRAQSEKQWPSPVLTFCSMLDLSILQYWCHSYPTLALLPNISLVTLLLRVFFFGGCPPPPNIPSIGSHVCQMLFL